MNNLMFSTNSHHLQPPTMESEPQIEIPSHFLCPISLQLMRDPVTVATGISYDRPSIEHWLSAKRKNKTLAAVCPVTKIPISSGADLTPNHTLRRLIQSWCMVNDVDRIPTPKMSVDRSDVGKLISSARKSQEQFDEAIRRVKLIERSSLRATGAFAFLASSLVLSTDHNDVVETVGVLAEIDASEDELKSVLNSVRIGDALINRLTQFLTERNPEYRYASIKLLRSLYSAAEPNQLTSVKAELFNETVALLRERHLSGTKWALKLLYELSPWGRNKVKAVNAGAIEALIEILLDCGDQKRVCELAMAVLDQLCGCAEGRAGLLGHGAGLAVVSKRILRVSNSVSDRAVRVIGSVSRHSGNGAVLGEMLQVGVVAKLCLVVQVECSLKTKERAKEILSAHSRVWRSSPCVPSDLIRSFPS